MYPSTEDLVAASTVAALGDLTGPQQDALRDAAIAAIESYCHQRFLAEGTDNDPVTKRLDGTGTRTLYLPCRIVEITEIESFGTEAGVTLDSVTISDDRSRLTLPETGAGTTWATRAYADAHGLTEAAFPAGTDNIRVTGIWGWTDDEYDDQLDAVTTAIRFDMEDKALAGAHALNDTVRAARTLGLNSVNQGRISLDLDTEHQLSARVKQQLVPFVFNHAGGATV